MFHGSPHAPCADQAKPSSRLPRSEATSVSCVLGIADHSATYNDPANHPRQREAAAALYKHIRPSRSHPDTSLTCGPGSLEARVRIPRKYALTCSVFNVRICMKYAKSRPAEYTTSQRVSRYQPPPGLPLHCHIELLIPQNPECTVCDPLHYCVMMCSIAGKATRGQSWFADSLC